MPRRPYLPLIASLLAVACVAAGGGALLYSAFASNGGTKTVVRQVTVNDSQPASSTTPLSINEIYRRSYRGVVQIRVSSQVASQFGGSQTQQAEGSGFVYDMNGNIVTNDHVVASAKSVKVTFWNGKTYDATIVGTDPSTDLAVIKVSAPQSQLHPLAVGDSSALEVGDGVVAIGSPFGLSETVTSGIVSALHRQITSQSQFTIPNSIQTDAAINHGNSGGPLLNTNAQVVGVNAQIQSDSGDNAGVGFAIPSNTVHSVASQLIASGKVEHAYLGVSLAANASTAHIAGVKANTPAAKAGLKAGDVVTSLSGLPVSTSDELAAAIAAHKPGDEVTITYSRNGSLHSVQLTLANRPS